MFLIFRNILKTIKRHDTELTHMTSLTTSYKIICQILVTLQDQNYKIHIFITYCFSIKLPLLSHGKIEFLGMVAHFRITRYLH